MTALPSVSYSVTVRLGVPAGGSAVSQLTTVVEHVGGAVTALDVTASGNERLRIDVTCAARDTEHSEQLVEAMRSVPGVVIDKISDRTFLMHLGGKIAMHAKHSIRNRDDLSMIYTSSMLLAAAGALAGVVSDDELNATYIMPSVFHADVHHVAAAVRKTAGGPAELPTDTEVFR